jgi:membrane-bound serine protease (ClpP class)
MGRYNNNTRSWGIALMLCLLLTPLIHAAQQPTEAAPDSLAAIVPLVGEIDNYSRDDLIKRFNKAKELGAKVIIIDIDSPGGVVTPSMELSRFLKRQGDVHTIAFVKEKAYSGAAMVAVACDEIWMAPNSPLGDCAPIIFNISGDVKAMTETERAKEESPVVNEFVDSAHRNGYDAELLAAMVSLRNPVYFVQNGQGELRIVHEDEDKKLLADGWKPATDLENVGGPGRLVTVYPRQAIALGLARGQVDSAQDLVNRLHDHLIADLTPGAGEILVQFFNHPLVRMVLLTIFLQCLYIILHAPGHGAAEAVAVVSLGLLLGVPLLTGHATWWEVAVIFAGLGLCAFEIFVFPGHMVSLILGTVMIFFGLVMTFVPMGLPGWIPSARTTWHGVQTGLLAVVGALICWFFLTLWLRRYLPSIPYFRKLILTETTGNTAALPLPGDRTTQEPWPFVGTIGVAATDLLPGGVARFPYADAIRPVAVVSAGGFVPQGTKVVVEEIQGSSVRVRVVS